MNQNKLVGSWDNTIHFNSEISDSFGQRLPRAKMCISIF